MREEHKLIFNNKINFGDIVISKENIEKNLLIQCRDGANYFELGQTGRKLQIFSLRIEKENDVYKTIVSEDILESMRHKDYKRIGWLAYVDGTIGQEVTEKLNKDKTWEWWKIPE